MRLFFGTIIFLGFLLPLTDIYHSHRSIDLEDETAIEDILFALTEKPSMNAVNDKFPLATAEMGESIVKNGYSKKPNGRGKTRKQSRHFVCTSCHNIEKEFSYPAQFEPSERLEYAVENNLPFLQATTFYGIVNRTSFYNGDYYKKYGPLVIDARHDIRNSIQLCATECSQGRALEDWEIEAILKYFWTLEYKLADIELPIDDIDLLENALNGMASKEKAANKLKDAYLQYSPATFIDPPVPRKGGREGYTGNPEIGESIYKLGCLHCHKNQRYSFYKLDESKIVLRELAKNLQKYNHLSAYQVVRYGTPPLIGKKAYMPHYTKEKMSIQQMEDLRAYILKAADYTE